jgi:hypothetical protein
MTETLEEHAPSHAIVKNWAAQFKCRDFFTCFAPRPGRPKTVTTPEIIDRIHVLILEDRRPNFGLIAEQLGISREGVGSIHEDLDMRTLSAKWILKCPNANQKRQRCQSSDQPLYFFFRLARYKWFPVATRLVTTDETWLYNYDPETKQQSMAWRRNGSPHPAPQHSECKNSLETFLSRFIWIKRASSSWPNYQLEVLLISAGTIEGHFEGKTLREGGHVLARQCPASPSTCHPEETGLPGLPVS